MSLVQLLYASREVWDGIGFAVAVTAPAAVLIGLPVMLFDVWHDPQ